MRCPDCSKFVSYEDPPTVEVESIEISGVEVSETEVTATVTAIGRIVLLCAECSSELKDSEFEIEETVGHDCTHAADVTDDSLEAEEAGSDGTSRLETLDRRGKPIKNYRYMKTYYGAEITATVTCAACGWEDEITLCAEEQASAFNELV